MARGDPIILNGLTEADDSWQTVHRVIRDISVYTVPAYHDKSQVLQRGNNAIFVLQVDGVWIAHLGDLGHRLTLEQFKMLGKIDILLVPIGRGRYTITAEEGREVSRQVKPRVAIPMHYSWEGGEQSFIQGAPQLTRVNGPRFKISKQILSKPTQYVILSWDPH
jgi:L-ascorbate metabolism protein UlaG (beta-lactamase superfamily)